MRCLVYIWLVAVLQVGSTTLADEWDLWWSYQPGFSGPGSWGGFNTKWRLCSIGRRQSPVDINPSDLIYDPNLKHLSISKLKVTGVLKNTGHDITIELDRELGNKVKLTEGPLNYGYRVEKLIIHFGSVNKQGSEHKINGDAFPAELQIYAYNEDLYQSLKEAEEANSGLAAISVLIAVNDSAAPSMIGELIQSVPQVQYKGKGKAVAHFSLVEILPETKNYITYEGSTTKPGCYESVTWIIMNKPVYITSEQLSILRQTVRTAETDPKSPLYDNFRPTQSVNRRPIRTNINFPEQKMSVCDMKREKTYSVNQHLTVQH